MKDFTAAELDEIRTSYRQAKSPRTQVDVLADLYACTRQDIERALGLPETPKRARPRNKGIYFKWTPELEERLIALYAQEASPSKAAALLGVPEGKVKTKVQKLRQSGRLPPAEKPHARCADAAEGTPVLQECSAPGRSAPRRRRRRAIKIRTSPCRRLPCLPSWTSCSRGRLRSPTRCAC